jgi:hypothetical protein
VAEDYFLAMQKVERDLSDEVVKVQEDWIGLIDKLELPELCYEERLKTVNELKDVLHNVYENVLPKII